MDRPQPTAATTRIDLLRTMLMEANAPAETVVVHIPVAAPGVTITVSVTPSTPQQVGAAPA